MESNLLLMIGLFMLCVISMYFATKIEHFQSNTEMPQEEIQQNIIYYQEIPYKNGIVKVPVMEEMAIKDDNIKDIICIGQKMSPDRIRNIKVGNKLMAPSYSSDFEWKISDDGKHVIVSNKEVMNHSVKIPISRAIYTGYQCWGGNGDETSDQSFHYHLSEYMQFIKN